MTHQRDRSLSLLLALALLLLAPGVAAQAPATECSVAELAEQMRKGHTVYPREVLGQTWRAQPMERLDALADSMVRIAITATRDGGVSQRAGAAAVEVLAWAGRGETGVAYPGASERLLIIAENADTGRAGALYGLLAQPNRGQALQYLRQVAISQNSVAYVAVGFLARDAGPEGLAVLRQLHRQGLVTHPLAQRELTGVAHYRGWP